ncbi:MAG: beta-ketoacyl synthase N-terminal-like domain-containing protein [Anaeroplasma sp.]
MTINKNRCVVTGLGMINAIGNSVDECFENALKSISGIKETKTVDTENCYAKLAAEVSFDVNTIPNTEGMDRVSKLCIKAAKEALDDANLGDFNGSTRVSVIMGSCVGGAVSIESYYKNGKNKDDILRMPISTIANQVAGYCHAGGVVSNIANACAAGTISIAYACDLIRAGKADIVLAGGADAFASVPYSGFLALHALDSNPCSPFNHCTGITLGEGSGCVIVESYEHAQKRNARMYCEILGSGVSSDAHHITAPRPDGEGQMNAIRKAISNSGIDEAEIGYINAHGTGTAKNDEAEFLSLHTIFDDTNGDLSVSSTKAMVGHCLGAAGAIEAVFAIKCLVSNKVLPTIGYSEDDLIILKEKARNINFVPNKVEDKNLETVMSNSFAFGGNNASIVFSKNQGNVTVSTSKAPVAVTGLGLVTPFGNDVANYVEAIKNNVSIEGTSISSKVDSNDYNALGLKMAFYRKLDNLSQLQAVSGMYALKDGEFTVTDCNATKIGIVVGSSEGALGTCLSFEENIAEKGNANGSAFKFPNTVYNAAGGYLSICSGIKGYNVTVTNGAQSGLQSIAYGMNIIRQGQEDYILATGTDENIEVIDELYNKLGLIENSKPYNNGNGFVLADGSISVLLESVEAAKERNSKVYCYVNGYGMAHSSVPFGTLKGSDEGLVNAIKNALDDANLSIDDIDAIYGFGNGHYSVDNLEINVYKKLFNDKLSSIPVFNIKERTGEGRAASATLSFAHAALMLSGKIEEDNAYIFGDSITRKKVASKSLNKVLITAYGAGGSYTAVVVSK